MGDLVKVRLPQPPHVRICFDATLKQPTRPDKCDGRLVIHAWLNTVVPRHEVDTSLTVRIDRLILPQRFTQPFEADTTVGGSPDGIDCCDGADIRRTGGNNIEVVGHIFNHWRPEIVAECEEADGGCIEGTVKFSWCSALIPMQINADTGLPFSDPADGGAGVMWTL